jgi:enoyl-CoA hydratase/carnithine racemase
MSLRSRPLNYRHFDVSFPQERIVQVTLNRPEKLNCIDQATSREIQEIWELFDQDESLWVGIITGNGRAFCTGADLQGRLVKAYLIWKTCSDRTNEGPLNRMERDEQGRGSQ